MTDSNQETIQTCFSCFYPNFEEARTCENCGITISMLDGVDPIRSLVAEGIVYRKASEIRPNKLVLIGVWLLFLPAMIICALNAVSLLLFGIGGGTTAFILFWILIAASAFSFQMLRVITRNYFRTSQNLG